MLKRVVHLMLLILITALILNSYYIISLIVMTINNQDNIMKSGLVQLSDLSLTRPQGDWYPLINAYVDNTFSNYIKKDVDLLIYYSYGDFKKGSSTILDPNSHYFNSFFGCYVIRQNETGFYGFNDDGDLDLEEILKVPEYDYDFLVAGSLGLENDNIITDYTINLISSVDGNHYVDLTITTNSLYHQYEQFNLNYLQYGLPYIRNEQQDFFPIQMSGKFKITKYNESITLIYYIFSPNRDIVKNWDI